MDVSIKVKTDQLDGGTFLANILISSNDPANRHDTVPVRLRVIGAPNIVLSPDTLDFGDAFVTYPDTLTLTVSNNGSDLLEVTGMSIDNPRFSVLDALVFDVAPNQSHDVRVAFSPLAVGPDSGVLSIASTDSTDPVVYVQLLGNGIHFPVMEVAPDSFAFTLNEGDSATASLTISNTGLGTLTFDVSHRFLSLSVLSANKTLAIDSSIRILTVELGSASYRLLDSLQLPYTLVDAVQFDTINLANFDLLFVGTAGSVQPLINRSADIAAFLQAGGGIVALYESPFNAWQWLPIAVTQTVGLCNESIHIVDSTHPAMDSLTDAGLSNWGCSYHGVFTSFDSSLQALAVGVDVGNQPVILAGEPLGGRLYITGTDNEGHMYRHEAIIMIGKAIAWAGGAGNWLFEEPDTGTVPPGGNANVGIKVKTDQLDGGTFRANILVSSNDPGNAQDTVPVNLTVIGTPNIVLSDDTLDFGDVFINYSDTLTLTVSNNGSDLLEVTGMSINNPRFSVLDAPVFDVAPNQSHDVRVAFSPLAVGPDSGVLSIASTDSTDPTVYVQLLGNGVEPPIIGVSPDPLPPVVLGPGDSTSQIVTISNSGGSDLNFNASFNPASLNTGQQQSGIFSGRTTAKSSVELVPSGNKEAKPEEFVPGAGTARITSLNGLATVPLPIYLNDALGYLWDIFGDGVIGDGTSDAYDGGLRLNGFGYFSTAETEENGREIVIGPSFFGSVSVTRKIYVPANAAFARFLEVLTNPTGSPRNVTVDIYTNLGSDGGEGFAQTSSGDATFTTVDNWITTDDVPNAGDPAIVHVLAGDGGGLRPNAVGGGQYTGFVSYSFNVTVPANGQAIIMHFGAQRINGTEGVAAAAALADLQGEALTGMSPEEKRLVLNFPVHSIFSLFPQSGIIPAGSDLNVTLGYNAEGLDIGVYLANLSILSNDPARPEVVLPTRLTVAGIPNIVLSKDTLNFGDVFINYPDTLTLTVSNSGTGLLEVTGMSNNNPRFSLLDAGVFNVPPGDSHTLRVQFLPTAVGPQSDTLSIASTDSTDPTVYVQLLGTGVHPPIMAVSPDSFAFNVRGGDSASSLLMVRNSGLGPLQLQLQIALESGKRGGAGTWSQPSLPRDLSALREDKSFQWDSRFSERSSFSAKPVPFSASNVSLPLVVRDSVGDGGVVDIRAIGGQISANHISIQLILATPLNPSDFGGVLGLDIDQDSLTGIRLPLGFPVNDVGCEYFVGFFSLGSGQVDLFNSGGIPVGSFPAAINSQSFSFDLPLSALG
ncbi:MAG: choice-of-anchor D domain-containing protein, partial [Limisphaerales bacterium]